MADMKQWVKDDLAAINAHLRILHGFVSEAEDHFDPGGDGPQKVLLMLTELRTRIMEMRDTITKATR